MTLTRSSSRNCKMTFFIGRGFAERQIVKKWKWPYLLNWVEYFDKLLRKHWYWQDLAQEIAKWHFSLAEALPSSKFWKKVIMALSLELSGILHTNWYWQNVPYEIVKWHLRLVELLPKFKFWKKWDYWKMSFIIGRGFAERQLLKKWKWPYLLNWVEYFNRLLRKHWYWQDLAQEIVKYHFSSVVWNVIFHRSRFCQAPNSEKVKMALSLELSGILWWNFAKKKKKKKRYWQDVAHEIVKWHLGLVEVLPRFKLWKKCILTIKPFGIFW